MDEAGDAAVVERARHDVEPVHLTDGLDDGSNARIHIERRAVAKEDTHIDRLDQARRVCLLRRIRRRLRRRRVHLSGHRLAAPHECFIAVIEDYVLKGLVVQEAAVGILTATLAAKVAASFRAPGPSPRPSPGSRSHFSRNLAARATPCT